jgi:aspartyl-tRNA(Asn)/glutamyl-tRNA(Gln) amidotransferase subunit C
LSLDRETIVRIAKLARIDVEDSEIDGLASELNNILDWVETLNSISTEGVEPMVGVGVSKAPLRMDNNNDGDIAEAVLANAPDPAPPYFTVPKVIE